MNKRIVLGKTYLTTFGTAFTPILFDGEFVDAEGVRVKESKFKKKINGAYNQKIQKVNT